MNLEQVDIKTPEYVSLQFQSAGLGSRAAAFIIDQILLIVVNILLLIGVITVLNATFFDFFLFEMPSYIVAGTIIAFFVINWGYFFALEYFWAGKTIGKKLLGIRVIQENGHSITLLSSLIRNLLRIIDSLPANYLLGMLMIFFHGKHKRLGDLVAGTIVVHERKKKNTKKLSKIEKEISNRGLSKDDLVLEDWAIKHLGKKEWDLLNTYSQRFLSLPEDDRIHLSRQLAAILFPKIGQEQSNKTYVEVENMLLVLYLVLKDEWEFEL